MNRRFDLAIFKMLLALHRSLFIGWFGMDGYWDWITISGIGINGCQRDVTLFCIRFMLDEDKGSSCWLLLPFCIVSQMQMQTNCIGHCLLCSDVFLFLKFPGRSSCL